LNRRSLLKLGALAAVAPKAMAAPVGSGTAMRTLMDWQFDAVKLQLERSMAYYRARIEELWFLGGYEFGPWDRETRA
jgi:hypothetical protein